MPGVILETNVKLSTEDSKALVQKLSKFSAEVIGKPESLVVVKYSYNEAFCFNGTFDPVFELIIGDIDAFSPEKNSSIIAQYTKFMKENLPKFDDKRGYIILQNPGKDNIGYMGDTVSNLLKLKEQAK